MPFHLNMRPSIVRIHPLADPGTLLSHSRPPPRLVLVPTNTPSTRQTRHLFSLPNILNSTLGPVPLRHLTHSTTLPYPSALLFTTVSSIELYPDFLPFTLASTVTARDPHNNLPTRATMRIGYSPFGLQEDWESVVRCDRDAGVIEARSAERSNEESLFEVLRTRWEITPQTQAKAQAQQEQQKSVTRGGGGNSHAKLDLHVQFRNPVYDQMFARVEGKVAVAVIAAFENRVGELAAQKQEQ